MCTDIIHNLKMRTFGPIDEQSQAFPAIDRVLVGTGFKKPILEPAVDHGLRLFIGQGRNLILHETPGRPIFGVQGHRVPASVR
jgi:hypothetical protein